MARGARYLADPHTAAYRLGQQGRPLSGQLLRAAESDESILETWRSGKRDRPRARPRDAGAPGFGSEPPDDFDEDEGSDEEPAARSEPREPRREPTAAELANENRRRGRAARPSTRTPRKGRSKPVFNPAAPGSGRTYVHSAASLVLGAVAYALVINLIRYGASGPKLWLKAKFLNETTGAGPSSAGGVGGTGVAGAGGAGFGSAFPGTAPGSAIGPGTLGGGIGGPTQVFPPGTHGGAAQGYAGTVQ